jgi:hypothetical protein
MILIEERFDREGGDEMKRSILFVLALTLIGSSAFAQLSPSYGSSNSPTVSPQGGAAYGTSAGVQNIYDPYGTLAAASRFGTSTGVQNIRDPYGTAAAASKFGPPQVYGVVPR